MVITFQANIQISICPLDWGCKRSCEQIEYPNKKQVSPKITSENWIFVIYNNIEIAPHWGWKNMKD